MEQLTLIIEARLHQVFGESRGVVTWKEIYRPELNLLYDRLVRFTGNKDLSIEAYVAILLALAPEVDPALLDRVIKAEIPASGDFPQIGGVRGKHHRGFLPTGETALFFLAGNDVERRLQLMHLFRPDHFLAQRSILRLKTVPLGEPLLSGQLLLDEDIRSSLLFGAPVPPRFSASFPAQRIETGMEWEDLILPAPAAEQIKMLEAWLRHGDFMMEELGMRKKLKPGCRALLHGPPGTGKTLTASLLGKRFGKEVYRIDLAAVISKYIGETEKNLSSLFDKAEHKDWILFFDEADALFGKRTGVKDAHDRYANQEVSFLLQRLEQYDGLVIMASNFKANIDPAFLRRFESVIHFPMPNVEERYRLWQAAFAPKLPPSAEVDIRLLAERYELSGASIMDVVRYCSLMALEQDQSAISKNLLLEGIRRAVHKEGKVI
jgi:hypothetical protein